jgi:hypothetical protein
MADEVEKRIGAADKYRWDLLPQATRDRLDALILDGYTAQSLWETMRAEYHDLEWPEVSAFKRYAPLRRKALLRDKDLRERLNQINRDVNLMALDTEDPSTLLSGIVDQAVQRIEHLKREYARTGDPAYERMIVEHLKTVQGTIHTKMAMEDHGFGQRERLLAEFQVVTEMQLGVFMQILAKNVDADKAEKVLSLWRDAIQEWDLSAASIEGKVLSKLAERQGIVEERPRLRSNQ